MTLEENKLTYHWSENNMKKLLSDGETYKINGFISKNNKNFDATLYLEDGKVKFKF